MQTTVSEMYLEGIKEGRERLTKYGCDANEELASLNRTLRSFTASSPVGQMLRGERDFWRNQLNKARAA